MSQSDSQYLEFNEIPNEGRKTRKFQVISKRHGYPLNATKQGEFLIVD